MTGESHNGTPMAPVKGTWKTGRDEIIISQRTLTHLGHYMPGSDLGSLGTVCRCERSTAFLFTCSRSHFLFPCYVWSSCELNVGELAWELCVDSCG